MGIYDREYYRDETRSSGFLSGAAPVCKAIIAINVVLFVAAVVIKDTPNFFDSHFAYSSDRIIKHWEVWRLLSASFVHGTELFPIVVNMIFLWLAGREMEAMHGSRDFLAMYVTAAVVSTLCALLADTLSTPGGRGTLILGAAGAVTAVMVLYTLYYPHREFPILPFIRIELWLGLLIFLGLSSLTLLRQRAGAGPGVVVAGAIVGGAVYAYFYKVQDLRWSRLIGLGQRRPRYRVISNESRDKVSPISATQSRASAGAQARVPAAAAFPDDQLDARLDEVLAKIAREGRAGLTEEDNRVLEEASQRARSRRSDHL